MFFHLLLTSDCNLQCRYCFGESLDDFDEEFGDDIQIDYNLPRKVTYDIADLKAFVEKDPDCVLTFYGGEPLMQMDKLRQIMDAISPKLYMMQTNGLLLDKLEPKYINRLHTLLVSIDGQETLTNHYRGSGTFRRVVDNLKLVRRNGFSGELIARMTVMEQTDIEKQVRWLLDNEDFSFTSIHWQLNAGFWGNDYPRRNFEQWSQSSYIPGVHALTRFWVDYMEQKGVVLRLYPLLGIANSLLYDEKECLMRCGSGWINYSIQTDGYIIPCPTMWGMKEYYLGHLKNSDPLRLPKLFVEQKPCSDCKILGVCGGRCLYTNITKRWTDENYLKVCHTVEELIAAVKGEVPRMRRLIAEGKIELKDFDYLKFNGCEIIP
ncbi:MAG: TIGR04084 family radical SAM/SPASM domain-containing protein [Candidatus Bathyarchaeota archaeon]|nr:TIGR04084 family radical SAM/SPASM domain-containing protein [Candidatus Bathyarchaeota archaeon]